MKNITGGKTEREEGWVRLVSAILIQAIRDARSRDIFKSLEATMWLSSNDSQMFMEAAGIDLDPLKLLSTGALRKSATERRLNKYYEQRNLGTI